ncbi:hypothetical protein GQ55_3G487900 [Panicum hallii var. hallii]|uniref:Uncharacterized protein n=1 Tax=Panicum hallii var. hallii TaxID=1504633 RepID=A0A2T7EJS9_9POAL|nr:hypothetical protein GQ55_3G487900 [Panicum hallii var. hallii]
MFAGGTGTSASAMEWAMSELMTNPKVMSPGYNYGLASMELTPAQLLHSFDWSLPDGMDQVDMSEAPGLGVRRKTPLLLCATPYYAFAAAAASSSSS